MSKRKSTPPWAQVPTGITIFATPEGWRHSIWAGGFICGRLDLPAEAGDDDAKAAARTMVVSLAADIHNVTLEIDWTAGKTPRSWNGTARPAEQ
ncbi:hypothetical protein [Streptacidiphilus cavernicola]|uniref:Uncharacterized protein n=1 Tax=Streptacidiphilus cavernicola TaxID=3342716 RepID=A0ABV6VXG4_9ACTN